MIKEDSKILTFKKDINRKRKMVTDWKSIVIRYEKQKERKTSYCNKMLANRIEGR